MRIANKTVILAKVETTAGTDAVPTGGANAIQVSNLSITPIEANMVSIKTIAPWLGGALNLVGTKSVKCNFDVLMAGSGTAATAPAWGQLLLGCAMAETTGLLTPDRVEYTPISDAAKTLTIYYYDDGVLHKLLMAVGNVKFSAKSGDVPKLTFEFIGVDGGNSAVSNPAATLTAWKIPPAVTKANVVDITLGCTYAAGELTGGTVYNSTGLDIDFGNVIKFIPMLSSEKTLLSDRDLRGTLELDLSAAQEVTQLGNVVSNAMTGMGFTIGTTSGNKIMLFAPAAQLLNPKKVDKDGARLIGFDVRLNVLNGNDELKIISL